MNHPCYNPKACCGASCYAEIYEEPCWGDVEAIDETIEENDNYNWVHACQGHKGVWLWNEKYKQKPKPIYKVLKNLVDKLESMEEPLNAIILMAQIHGMEYTGPNWGEELKAAKEILDSVDER